MMKQKISDDFNSRLSIFKQMGGLRKYKLFISDEVIT